MNINKVIKNVQATVATQTDDNCKFPIVYYYVPKIMKVGWQ